MSVSAPPFVRDAPSSTAPRSRHLPLDHIADLARRRASRIDSSMSNDELVHRLLARFADTFGGRRGVPADLDGWVRRTVHEIVVEDRRRKVQTSQGSVNVEMVLRRLVSPVRSPALAKQRKQLLRRISDLVPGVEYRVLVAMINEPSLDRAASRLGINPLDVARLHRLGVQHVGDAIDRDPELAEQLRIACRQPQRARTSK